MQFTDQLGREIELKRTPKRIVSLVPSQTELLAELGLVDEVVGITKFCVHPKEWLSSKTKIGGTKNVKVSRVLELKPDLIIANKEENTPEVIEKLEDNCPVWVSDIQSLDDNYDMILKLGEILNRSDESTELVKNIKASFKDLAPKGTPLRTLYMIWKDPYMIAGKSTFVHEMMTIAGFENVSNKISDDNRYPSISEVQISEAKPDVVLLSSEPYPFKNKHIEEIKNLVPNAKVVLVDGELFSWYGPRLLKSARYFKELHRNLV